MTGEGLELQQSWVVGESVGSGGFGHVYALEGDGPPSVTKFVPKAPGSDRELLFVDLGKAKNVVPIIDSGEHGEYWVLVMPKAERSLRELLESSGGRMDVDDALSVLLDISAALVSLEGGVVHRDLKPDNVLLLDGTWSLADFGIARYAEASTAPDTQKYSLTPQYAAPERWRVERASSAADIYSVGVMAYEMMAGELPFPGPTPEEFREQHLHDKPPPLGGVPIPLSTLIEECLFKAPEARPTPANLTARLSRIPTTPTTGGLADLAEANRQAVSQQSEFARSQSEEQTEAAIPTRRCRTGELSADLRDPL